MESPKPSTSYPQDPQLMSLLLHFTDYGTADLTYRWWQKQPPRSVPGIEATSVSAVRGRINEMIAAAQRDLLRADHQEQQAQHGLL